MKRLIFIIGLIAGLIFAACTTLSNPFDENDPNYIEGWDSQPEMFFDSLGLKFDMVIKDGSIRWYNDADLEDFIEPAVTHNNVLPGVTWRTDYQCTELPDTLWGIIKRPYPETFYCRLNICISNDNKLYSIENYRAELMASCP
jgi:hypothetical protein